MFENNTRSIIILKGDFDGPLVEARLICPSADQTIADYIVEIYFKGYCPWQSLKQFWSQIDIGMSSRWALGLQYTQTSIDVVNIYTNFYWCG